MDLKLEGLSALVTGGGTGIGFAIAQVLAEEGVRVVLAGRRRAVLEAAAARLAGTGPDPLVIPADLAAPGAGRDLASAALAAAGRIDILVNNAGVSRPLGIGAAEADWAQAYALRVVAVRHLAEALLPAMRERGFGRIITVGGSWEVQPVINSASVMNAARTVYHKSLSHMVAAQGVTVNTIGPGVIESEQIARIFADPAERQREIAETIPAGRFGQPRELAVLAAFLASPLAGYITGETIAVDGGRHRFAF